MQRTLTHDEEQLLGMLDPLHPKPKAELQRTLKWSDARFEIVKISLIAKQLVALDHADALRRSSADE